MKRIIDALKKTAITLGIALGIGTLWFCIIRFFSPEMAVMIIFMLIASYTFYLHYKK